MTLGINCKDRTIKGQALSGSLECIEEVLSWFEKVSYSIVKQNLSAWIIDGLRSTDTLTKF